MDTNGNVTDTYTYDAFGNQISKTGTTANVFLYDGEQIDTNTGFYNLRARWMNPSIGRFQNMDMFEGSKGNPLSLHKYTFGSNDSTNRIDPSGNDDGGIGNIPEPNWLANVPSSCEIHLEYNAFIPGSLGQWLPEPFPFSPYEYQTDQRGFGGGGTARVRSTCAFDESLIGHLSLGDINYQVTGSGSVRRKVGSQAPDPTAGPFNTGWASVLNENSTETAIEMEGEGPYGYQPILSPNIKYDVIFDIHTLGNNMMLLSIRGTHTNFPSQEGLQGLYPDNQDVYEYDAPANGETGPNLINLNTFTSFSKPPILMKIK